MTTYEQVAKTIRMTRGEHNFICLFNISDACFPCVGIDAECKIVDDDSAVIISRHYVRPNYSVYSARVESTGQMLAAKMNLLYAIGSAHGHWEKLGWKVYGSKQVWTLAVNRALNANKRRMSKIGKATT